MEFPEQVLNDAGGDEMRSFDDEMSGFPVQRVAEGMKFLKLAQRIGYTQQRAIAIMARPFEKYGRGNVQIDDPPRVVQPRPVLGIQHDTAPGGDNAARAGSQFADCLCFTAAEALLALDFEDGRDGDSGTLDDFMVGVMKLPAEPPGKLPADGRLAGPHQADQVDIAAVVHGSILADARSVQQKTTSGKAGPLTCRPDFQLICNLSETMRGVMKKSSSRRCPVSFWYLKR